MNGRARLGSSGATGFLLGLVLWLYAMPAFAVPVGQDVRARFPDPHEREAFQSRELERRFEFHKGLRDAVSTSRGAGLQDQFDVTSYRLQLDLTDVEGRWISGEMRMRARVVSAPLDSVHLDFSTGMQVDDVLINGAPAPFVRRDPDVLIATPPDPLSEGPNGSRRALPGASS